jgi:hypothetical protein
MSGQLRTYKSHILDALERCTNLPKVLTQTVWELLSLHGQRYCAAQPDAFCTYHCYHQGKKQGPVLKGVLRSVPYGTNKTNGTHGSDNNSCIQVNFNGAVNIYFPDLIGPRLELGCIVNVPQRSKTSVFAIAGYLVSFQAISSLKRHFYILSLDELALSHQNHSHPAVAWKNIGEVQLPSSRRPNDDNVIGCNNRLYFFGVNRLVFWLEPLTLKVGTIAVPDVYGSPHSLVAFSEKNCIYACWCQPRGHRFHLYQFDIDTSTWTEVPLPPCTQYGVKLAANSLTGLLGSYMRIDPYPECFPDAVERYDGSTWTVCTQDFNNLVPLVFF